MAETNITGLFKNHEVRARQLLAVWPTTYEKSDATYGWFAGGLGPSLGATASTDRIDYLNDTNNSVTRGSLDRSNSVGAGAAGNTSYGWWGGGESSFSGGGGGTRNSQVSRIDYSNDSSTASSKGSLTIIRAYLGATGNKNYGYFAAGYGPAGTSVSSIDRINYASDSTTSSATANLNYNKSDLQASGNASYGWFVAGSASSTIERMDYSSDLTALLVRSSFTKYSAASTGNSNYAWYSGGTGHTSLVHRLDYAADTSTLIQRGSLPVGRSYMGGAGSSDYGYVAGGADSPSSYSRVYRITYANDASSLTSLGTLSSGSQRWAMGATGGYPG